MTQVRHCFPEDLFADPQRHDEASWTCVRVRPRWEKKFAQWLTGSGIPHFLPLLSCRTVSHRKVRQVEKPLFPGYVFVPGFQTKQAFAPSCCVVRLLHPRSEQEGRKLAGDLLGIYRMLASGDVPSVTPRWSPGQSVRVLSGPLMGTLGRYVREAGQGRFVIGIELLGVEASVMLAPGTPLEAV